MDKAEAGGIGRTTRFGWMVFALIMGLMLSDYMSRQVLGAVAPELKRLWQLTDGQIGQLGAIIPVMVGLMTFPLSLLADRYGRVRAIVVMALVWSAATFACGLASQFGSMLAARALIGMGEAAYGSVGLAVVLSVFPATMRARLTATFMAGGTFGSVLGVALGGRIAGAYGWHWAFFAMAALGLLLALAFALLVRERRLGSATATEKPKLRSLMGQPILLIVFVASGLQLAAAGALIIWLPSYFNRAFDLPLAQASQKAALVLLAQGVGMMACGAIGDWFIARKWQSGFGVAMGFGLLGSAFLYAGFAVPPSPLQVVLIAVGASFAAGHTGAVGATVARLAPPALLGTAFAVLTIANNIFGLAPGPWLVGRLADGAGLAKALQYVSLAPIAAAMLFAFAWNLSTRRA